MADTFLGDLNRDNEDYKITIQVNDKDNTEISCYLPEQTAMSSESIWTPFMDSILPTNALGRPLSAVGYQLNPLFGKIATWEGNRPFEWTFDLQFNANTSAREDVLKPIVYLLGLTMPTVVNDLIVKSPGPNLLQSFAKGTGAQNNKSGTITASLLNQCIGIAQKGLSSVLENLASSLISSGQELTSQLMDAFNSVGTTNDPDNMVTVYIGNFMTIQNVIITDVAPKIDSQFRYGTPVSAECAITFKTLYPPTREEMQKWFNIRSNRLITDLDPTGITSKVADFVGLDFL